MDTQSNKEVYKYKREELSSDSDEHKFVKNFFETTRDAFTNIWLSNVSYSDFKVYKITKNQPSSVLNEKGKNLMLFHGTKKEYVDSILKEGFKNSKKGWFGKGVYMTECSDIAKHYSSNTSLIYSTSCRGLSCVFVNEVLKSEKLRILKRDVRHCDIYTKPEHAFEKRVLKWNKQPAEEDYKEDALGRRYRNVGFPNPDCSQDEFIADESLVVPRYLIEFEDAPVNEKKIFNSLTANPTQIYEEFNKISLEKS